MKVIGAGLPRTATTTQLLVLERLGFVPTYHMRDLFADLATTLPLWERAAAGDPDWDAIFGDAQAAVDFPAARFYRELAEYYPDAKVLLSVRSPEGWVRSMRETVWGIFHGDSLMHHMSDARTTVDPLWRRYIALMGRMNWDEQIGALAGDTGDDDAFAQIMERWNDSVRETVPSERLLVWDPRDGWEPLCRFLEVDVPSEPLPRVNDTAAFKEGIIGGALAAVSEFWEARERPAHGLHGAPLE